MDAAARCTDLVSTSQFLGFAPQNLYYLVALGDRLYQQIKIPKRSNPDTYRKIHIPCSELKGVQRAILSKILSEIPVSRHAYGYVRGRSVIDAASQLTGINSVLKFDLKDFFPSISEERIFGLFKSLEFSSASSWILTKLCVFDGALCQGAPTSPYLSNLVCRRLDNNLFRLANSWGLKYLRYSDDLFIYGAKDYRYKEFQGYARKIIKENGFQLNNGKTKYCPIGKPRFTLGLLTHNKSVALPRKTRRDYRAAFFKASRNLKWARENIDRLSGMAEWYKAVYGSDETYFEYRKVIQNIRQLRLHDTYAI